MDPHDLLQIATGLARGAISGGMGRPRQAELRRAISAAYYALFHTLALCGANTLVGTMRTSQNRPAWIQVYRALEHGYARNQCNNRETLSRFSQDIQSFASLFVYMQRYRQTADYAPDVSFSRSEVVQLIDETARIITRFDNVDTVERRAFAVLILFRLRYN